MSKPPIWKRLFAKEQPKEQPKERKSLIARFDAAGYSTENAKHWAAADYLSADAEANESVRRTLRVRCRYEVANNSYAKGMLLTLANDTIGTGPRLQILSEDEDANSRIEGAFMRWSEKVDLPGKLRTARLARCQDGEVFILLAHNGKLNDEVQLDLQLIEADRISAASIYNETDSVDGIKFDPFGNPTSYRMLKYHPGSDEVGSNSVEFVQIPAENMIHYFRADRPGQHRGVPEITSALPLFAQLRRFTLAVLSAAEAAADFAAILYTDTPPDGETEDVEPLDSIELRRNMMLTVPAGWKMGQLDPKQPCSTYAEFKGQILNEIARCLNMPFNIAAGNSSGYNYASGRLDHQTYFKSLRVERSSMVTQILNRIFALWLREYILVTGEKVSPDVEHSWFWDGFEHVDPGKEANAIDIKLKNGTTTYAAEYSKVGRDWEDEFVQIAKEKKRMAELGITLEDLTPADPENNVEKEQETDE